MKKTIITISALLAMTLANPVDIHNNHESGRQFSSGSNYFSSSSHGGYASSFYHSVLGKFFDCEPCTEGILVLFSSQFFFKQLRRISSLQTFIISSSKFLTASYVLAVLTRVDNLVLDQSIRTVNSELNDAKYLCV